jgi:hypothetical protein
MHKFSKQRWLAIEGKRGKPIEDHVNTIFKKLEENMITIMKLVYWLATNCLPLASYPHLCNLARDLNVANMPI